MNQSNKVTNQQNNNILEKQNDLQTSIKIPLLKETMKYF